VLGRQHHEGDAVEGVRTGREDAQFLLLDAWRVQTEGDLHALAAPDPVLLHGDDPLRPVDLAVVQQFVGVVGYPEEPLFQVSLGDRRAAALALAAGQDLLVGQDGLAGGAPVGGRLRAVG
jgi:hypothetical protein